MVGVEPLRSEGKQPQSLSVPRENRYYFLFITLEPRPLRCKNRAAELTSLSQRPTGRVLGTIPSPRSPAKFGLGGACEKLLT